MLNPRSIQNLKLGMLQPMLDQRLVDEVEQIGAFLDTVKSHFGQASELAELGAYSSMYAHEVNNLMTQIGGRAQLALMNTERTDLVVRALQLACHASTQIAQLSEIFLASGATGSPESAPKRVSEIHRQTLGFISDEQIASLGFTLELQDPEPSVSFPPILLQQVLLNLYLNAIRAVEDRPSVPDAAAGRISITIEQPSEQPGKPEARGVTPECSSWNTPHIRIVVEDNGTGMSEDQLTRLFDQSQQRGGSTAPITPTTSTMPTTADDERQAGRGHGLGLAICKKLLEQARGTLHAESTIGRGTRMIITLPREGEGEDEGEASQATPRAAA